MNLESASGSSPLGLAFRAWRLAAILPALLLVCCTCAFPLDPSLDISQYAHTAWKVRDGFTKGVITSIAQTPDGYLWLGTEFGLLRFDGVRAVPWNPPGGKQLPDNCITGLLVARDGTLWIATLKGLASWKNGALTQYVEVAGEDVHSPFEDRDRTVWFGVYEASKGRVCAIRAGKVECYGEGTFGDAVSAVFQDRRGNLWVSSYNGVWRWAPGPPEHYVYPRGVVEANALIEDDAGALVLATNDGLKQLGAGKIENYSLPGISGQFRPLNFLRSRDGSLWFGTALGLLHLHHGIVDGFRSIDGLSSDAVTSIFEDREGNVWVATVDGLDRFREYTFPTISRNQGLSGSEPWSVQATPDGSIWIGATGVLNRWTNGQVAVYRDRSTLGQRRRTDEADLNAGGKVTEIGNSGLVGTPESLGVDDTGRLWASTVDGLFYFDGGSFFRVPGIPGGTTFSIAGDGNGNVWILQFKNATYYWSRQGHVQHTLWSQFSDKSARTMLPDREPGGLWLGFYEGGVVHLKNGIVVRSYGSADGLGDGPVDQLHFDSGGSLWAATEGGLSRLTGDHFETLNSKNGLPCDGVHWSKEDGSGSVWLYMPCGLVRVAQSELDAWASGATRSVQATVFDATDGVRAVGTYGSFGPHVTRSPDGRIWFLPWDGVSVIDPHHLPFNNLPPPVHIEEVIADGKTYDPAQGQRLPPLVRDLAIDYTALSLVAPEKLRFRFMLEGQDKDWREVVNERHAHYTNLPPRHYRFRVIAANNSGVWNETGDSVDFDIPPAWYQTMGFRALCLLAFMALLWAIYLTRVQQLREQEKKFREAVETMPALAFVADRNGNRTFFNRGWLEYTGMNPEQASGSGWEKAIHPDDVNRVLERWRTSQQTGQHLDYELRLRRGSDGVYRWFQTRARPVLDSRGKVVKWCAVASDIEDRKQAERLQADLTHANRVSTMGELVASISHELAQPITVTGAHAKASLRWLQRDPPNLAEALSGIPKIVEASALAAGIIDRLRSLYKKAPPRRECVAVNEVITDMTAMLRSEARSHGVSIRTDLKDDLPMTTADRVQLQQVLMNLMLNAIEAMGETGGVLTLKSQLNKDGQIQISVNDTGPGLPHDKKDQIFEPFFTMKPAGSGMGLAICKSIVESHCGRIWANGNGGRGATFHFTLPVAAADLNDPNSGA
jgi:PAS domain S-box-containing protein